MDVARNSPVGVAGLGIPRKPQTAGAHEAKLPIADISVATVGIAVFLRAHESAPSIPPFPQCGSSYPSAYPLPGIFVGTALAVPSLVALPFHHTPHTPAPSIVSLSAALSFQLHPPVAVHLVLLGLLFSLLSFHLRHQHRVGPRLHTQPQTRSRYASLEPPSLFCSSLSLSESLLHFEPSIYRRIRSNMSTLELDSFFSTKGCVVGVCMTQKLSQRIN